MLCRLASFVLVCLSNLPNTVGALSVYYNGQVKVVSYSCDSCGVFETAPCLPPDKECLYLSSLFLSLCARFGCAIQACLS